MRLEVRNIGKVKYADIDIDGITVIAAANNTGKSTLGKALYSLLSPFHDYDINVRDGLVRSIQRVMVMTGVPDDIRSFASENTEDVYSGRITKILAERIVQEVQYGSEKTEQDVTAGFLSIAFQDYSENTIGAFSPQERWPRRDNPEVLRSFAQLLGEDEKYFILRTRIAELLSVSNEQSAKEVTQRIFKNQFDNQIRGLFPLSSDESEIVFSDEESKREAKFIANQCILSIPAMNEKRRIYILDDPSLLDNMHRRPMRGLGYRDKLIEAIFNRMGELQSDVFDDLAGSVVAQGKMQEILSVFDKTVHAVLASTPSGLVIDTDETVRDSIRVSNSSMGVKAFAIIRFLIENGIVSDDDVLVLDEPEIHLHPEWQITYAHALVLIAKVLDIKMLVTTHSPYFLQALVDYAYALDYSNQMSVYTAELQEDGSSVFVHLDDDGIADIFDIMARPFLTLQKVIANKNMKG